MIILISNWYLQYNNITEKYNNVTILLNRQFSELKIENKMINTTLY